ncbi:MAG: phage integrase SAM-like domain-containing protein [Bacteroidetes bacterium]|nr:phage integrase SAM-like domain-containing protein [Bacteroidota bacterium]
MENPCLKLRNYTGSDGLQQVRIYYTHKTKVTYIDTGVRVNSKYFNGNVVSSKDDDYESKNLILQSSYNKVKGIIQNHLYKYKINPSIEYLRAEYEKEAVIMEKEINIFPLFREWYLEKGKEIKNIKMYVTIEKDLKHLRPNGKLYFREIDKPFIKRIFDYLIEEKKLQNSTVVKRYRGFKQFLVEKWNDGVNEYNYFDKFTTKLQGITGKENIFILTPKEFNTLVNKDFGKKKYLDYTRDLFVISSTTSLRFSDCIRLNPNNFTPDKKYLITDIKKTESFVKIPLSDLTKKVLSKYNYQLRTISNQKCNKYLKEALIKCDINSLVPVYSKSGKEKVMVMKPKYDVIRFHSSRKFWVSTAVNSGIGLGNAMKISNHKTLAVVNRYITDDNSQEKEIVDLFKVTKPKKKPILKG